MFLSPGTEEEWQREEGMWSLTLGQHTLPPPELSVDVGCEPQGTRESRAALVRGRKLGVHRGSGHAGRLRPSQSSGGTSCWASVFSFVKCRIRLSAQLVSLRGSKSQNSEKTGKGSDVVQCHELRRASGGRCGLQPRLEGRKRIRWKGKVFWETGSCSLCLVLLEAAWESLVFP